MHAFIKKGYYYRDYSCIRMSHMPVCNHAYVCTWQHSHNSGLQWKTCVFNKIQFNKNFYILFLSSLFACASCWSNPKLTYRKQVTLFWYCETTFKITIPTLIMGHFLSAIIVLTVFDCCFFSAWAVPNFIHLALYKNAADFFQKIQFAWLDTNGELFLCSLFGWTDPLI